MIWSTAVIHSSEESAWGGGGLNCQHFLISLRRKNIFMDFNFLNCLCTLNIPTGNIDAFAHETKIMAKSAIKANNYSHTVTFIVTQLKTRTCWIKNKQRCTQHPREPGAVIWAAIIINYTSTIKQMWEKLCSGVRAWVVFGYSYPFFPT